jgi:hypothetical protein
LQICTSGECEFRFVGRHSVLPTARNKKNGAVLHFIFYEILVRDKILIMPFHGIGLFRVIILGFISVVQKWAKRKGKPRTTHKSLWCSQFNAVYYSGNL